MQNFNLPVTTLRLPASGSIESYLQYANSIPVLTKEEEHEMAMRWYQHADMQAVQGLVLSHLRYVVRIAKNYAGYGLDISDLVQEGTIGLMKAIKKFEPSRELRLVTFAMHWIRAEIHEFIIRNWRIVKVATTKAQRKLFFKLRTMKPGLGWLTDSEVKDIADELGVKTSEVLHMETRMYSNDMSFDLSPDAEDEDDISAPSEYLASDDKFNPENAYASNESVEDSKSYVSEVLNELDPREKYIIESRWLHGNKPKSTLATLAKHFKISEERVRQIEKKAISSMRSLLVGKDVVPV